ncbi:MAG: hypothetical protein KatS3mg057_2890 [Herpetosiphonaceae bacterium]|nr:MAG: hypothetical protein KatS3mg057_2890 [Herpetosiphonaceae bacterium]
MVEGMPRVWLRLEGLAILLMSILLYALQHQGWLLFAVLFFAPDLSIAGYLAGPGAGSLLYNVAHSYVIPALLAGLGLVWASPLVVALALIWTAHIGFDRFLGYGLKYPGSFKETHLGRLGPGRGA